MANGNMGDLSMRLTLQSRIEDETRKIIQELNKVDASGRKAQEALSLIKTAVSGIKGAEGFKDIERFLNRIGSLGKDGGAEASLLEVKNRFERIKDAVKDSGASVTIFANGVSKSANDAALALQKLSATISEISSAHGKGLNSLGVGATDNLRQSLSVLTQYETVLRQIASNGGIHPVTGLVSSDVTKSADYVKAMADAKRYYQEVTNAMQASVEAEKRNEQKVEEILQRRAQARQRQAEKEAEAERQRQEQARLSAQIAQENAKSEIAWQEQKSKAFSDAIKKQMQASVEAERTRQVSLFTGGFDTSVFEKRIAMLNRMKEIQEKLAYYQPKLQYAWLDYETSAKFGNANTPAMRHREDDLQRLRNTIAALEDEFNKLGGNAAFKNVDDQIKHLEQTIARLKDTGGTLNIGKMLGLENKPTDEFALAKQAAMAKEAHVKKQNELNAAFEKYFRLQEQAEAAEKRLAEAITRTNQARREAVAASRQQAENLVRDRVKELEAQRRQLQGLYGSGKGVLDTSELAQIRAAFSQITREINTLRGAMQNLDGYSIRDLFSLGRGTSNYSALAGSMETVIRQKQEAIALERKHQEEIAQTAARARRDLASAFAGVNAEAQKMQGIMGDIKSLFLQGGLVFGAQQFFNSIVQTGGEIVQQHIALRSILGDVRKADELFAQTQQLALESPFKFGELNRDVKQLAAFGVEANDLYDTAKRLADIASGLGVSFERLGLAYGQVKARAWLDGKELRQFAYAGLPMLQKITDLYNAEGKNGRTDYTTSDVKGMITKREVSFEDVQKVLWNMTDQGGQFYNMQLVLSETLLGRWNKLIDAWDIMLGKFADGNGIIGGTFSRLIDLATKFVLALDTMSPALMTFGGLMALRKVSSVTSSKVGIGSNLAALQAEQQAKLRTYAVEQQQLLIEGKITQEKMRQNIADYQGMLNSKLTVRNSVEQAALEGRLSALQLQKAYRQKLILADTVEQLRLMGMISAKESELIMKQGARARGALMLNQGMGALGGFFSGWNIVTIGATVAMGLASAYKSFKDSITQETDKIAGDAKAKFDALSSALNEVGAKGTGVALQEQVDKMTDVLKQSGLYTDSIKEQIASTNDLGKEYDILKQKITEAKEANSFKPGEAEMYANAKKATGAGFAGGSSWFGQWTGIGQDDIDENTKDVASALAALQIKMQSFSDTTKSAMEQVANSMLGAKAAGMSFEEKIATICSERGANGYWETLVQKVSGGNKDVERSLRGLQDDLDDFSHNFGEITTDDIPKYLEEMAKRRNMSLNDFSKWCKQHPVEFRTMLDQMLSEANSKVPTLVKRLQQVARAILNIGNTEPDNNGGKPKVWKNPLKKGTIGRKAFDKLLNAGKLQGGEGGFWQKEMGNLIFSFDHGKSKGWHDFGEALRSKYKEVWQENNASKNAKEKQSHLREQRMLEAIASQLGVSLDVGKDKVTGAGGKTRARQEDKELKALQERIESFKKARQKYQSRKPYMSWEAAKQEVYELFPNIKGLDLDDYLGSIAKITPSDDWFNKSTERKKYLSTINAERADWSLSEELKPEFERISADFTEALNKGASQFDLYKSLLEKTGSKTFADQAFKEGAIWDDQSLNLAQQFKEMMGFDADINASDATAKHYLVDIKGNKKAYELWKQIVELVQGNYTDALNESADILKEAMDYEEQIVAIQEKYNKLIKEANETGNKRAAIAARQKRDKEVGDVNLKKFKNSEDYLNFYGAIYSLGAKQAQEIAAKIRRNLNKALADGTISAREYGKEIKELQEQLQKLSEVQPSFMHGGLNGVVQSMQNRGSSQMTQGQNMYDTAKKAYDIAQQAQNVNGMQSAQSGMDAGNAMSAGGAQLMQGAGEMMEAIKIIDTIIHGINDLVQGLNDTFQDIKETAEALGADTDSDSWTDANSFFSGFSSASASATKGWDSLKNGDMGGVISGVVGSFTGWIKAFAAGHDQKLDNQIKIAERQEKLLENISNNVKTVIESTLGGIYNYQTTDYTKKQLQMVKSDYERRVALEALFNGKVGKIVNYSDDTYAQTEKALSSGTAYDEQLASLIAQRDTLQQKRDAENAKKKKDQSKIDDYDSQIEEMRLKIKSFAQDFLKDIYSIDMKSWASDLTDAIVSAWESGEDAAEAYRDKVKELVKDVTKNIVSQKIMEKALEKPLEYLTGLLEEKGQLDETDMDELAKQLYEVGDTVVPQIEGIFDALKDRGWDFRDNDSSSTTNSVEGITEETADVLASYLNAIRLDVSVNRENVKQIAEAVTCLPNMNIIAESQLASLNQLVVLAEYRNGKLDDMYAWMRSVTKESGSKSIRVN